MLRVYVPGMSMAGYKTLKRHTGTRSGRNCIPPRVKRFSEDDQGFDRFHRVKQQGKRSRSLLIRRRKLGRRNIPPPFSDLRLSWVVDTVKSFTVVLYKMYLGVI
ncbi:hypothetical protein TNIN_472341 [Trichonephila inaurata madagascariensis]|uniref:Uncharacterized protein n=1 Tax=Trichonephila inaurata madagascariensis TaxID=2747483 RepID=A0A8X7CAS3_9ARAC|nr:hypothetical protein TNIN_472341 [Trichonephila inaurata madagascariensis]